LTRLATPLGSPVFSSSEKTRAIVIGTLSDGFTTAVFPQAIAYGRNQSGIIPGKLKGVTMATTPSGCRIIVSSIPLAMSSLTYPCKRMGIPQATSTFSMPRRSSPMDSSRVFPHSRVTVRASSSRSSSRSCLSLKRTWMRSPGGVRRQAGNASAAADTARSTSEAGERGTEANVSPVAGFTTGSDPAPEAAVQAPPM